MISKVTRDKITDTVRTVLVYVFVIGGLGGGGYWLWRNPIYNPAGPQVQAAKSQIEVRFKDAVVKGRKQGTPYWTVYAKTVESERQSSKVFFKDKPNGEFYNLKDWSKNSENNSPQNVVTGPGVNVTNPAGNTPTSTPATPTAERLRTFIWNADEAEYDQETEDLTLRKNVSIVTDDKDTIKTDELLWKNSEEKAVSNKRTTITGKDGKPVIYADRLEADVKLDILNLKGNVEIITELTEDQQL